MRITALLAVIVMLLPTPLYAAHPLITDDADTQGKGKYQIEVNGEYDVDSETVAGTTVKTTVDQAAATLTYGVADRVDIAAGIPYQWTTASLDGAVVSREHGVSDATLEVKWRFYEKEGLSVGIKPGMSFPTGNDAKGLGTGKTGYSLFFITTQEMKPWTVHLNLGYRRNENAPDVDERVDIWHVSAAVLYGVTKDLQAVANIGIERNRNKESNENPAFALGGFIYSVTEDFDIDCGVKAGLNEAETDYSLLAGTTFRF